MTLQINSKETVRFYDSYFNLKLLNKDSIKIPLYFKEDTSSKYLIKYNENLKKGNYSIVFKSIFNTEFKYDVTINSNRSIYILQDSIYYKKTDFKLPNQLDNDTLNLVFVTNGCFHHFIENIKITKENTKYKIVYFTDSKIYESDTPRTIIKYCNEDAFQDLMKIQHYYFKTQTNLKSEFDLMPISTTHLYLYFNLKNNVFTFENYLDAFYDLYFDWKIKYGLMQRSELSKSHYKIPKEYKKDSIFELFLK